MISYISLFVMVVLASTGQILIKKGAVNIHYSKGLLKFITTFFNKFIIVGAIVSLLAPCFYIYALINVELSIAYTFTAFIYIFVFLGSWLILKESANFYHFVGMSFIFFGICIFNS
ncbi:MAG: EamA family transporter [bacterium]